MTNDNSGQDQRGRLDDDAEEREPSSTSEGPAADGDYDPAQGSPGQDHPTGEDFPAEATRYDDPEHRRADDRLRSGRRAEQSSVAQGGRTRITLPCEVQTGRRGPLEGCRTVPS